MCPSILLSLILACSGGGDDTGSAADGGSSDGGSSDGGAGDGGGSADGGGGDGGSPDGGAETYGDVTARGLVMDMLTLAAPPAGTVCMAGTSLCSEVNGTAFELSGLPDADHVHLQFSFPGYPDFYWSYDTAVGDKFWTVAVPSQEAVDDMAAAFGATWPSGTGTVLFKVVDAGIDPLLGATGHIAGVSPEYYLDDAGQADPAQDSTGATGVGIIGGVSAGSHDLVVYPPGGKTCTPHWGWTGSTEGSIDAVAFADGLTFVEMKCTP